MILVIDNYDSFTYNLVHYLDELGAAPVVYRNDALSVAEALGLRPEAVVLSPGPCTPNEAGICIDLIRAAADTIPILGVCLGHQAIGEAYGGRIVRAPRPIHGKASRVHHDGRGLFQGVPAELDVARYHSLVIEPATCPAELEITARTADGIIMGVRHRTLPVEGVQFHPESVLTSGGMTILANFLRRCGLAPTLA